MRLYLSSYGLGNNPEALLALLGDKTRVAVILNASDASPADRRQASLDREIDNLKSSGLEPSDLDLRAFFGRKEAFRAALKKFDMVWVRGGNCFVLRRAFKQSGADEILDEMLRSDDRLRRLHRNRHAHALDARFGVG